MLRITRLRCGVIAALAVGAIGCQKSQTPSEGGAEPASATASQVEDEASREPVTFEGTRIAVIHTANLIGELEPCG